MLHPHRPLTGRERPFTARIHIQPRYARQRFQTSQNRLAHRVKHVFTTCVSRVYHVITTYIPRVYHVLTTCVPHLILKPSVSFLLSPPKVDRMHVDSVYVYVAVERSLLRCAMSACTRECAEDAADGGDGASGAGASTGIRGGGGGGGGAVVGLSNGVLGGGGGEGVAGRRSWRRRGCLGRRRGRRRRRRRRKRDDRGGSRRRRSRRRGERR